MLRWLPAGDLLALYALRHSVLRLVPGAARMRGRRVRIYLAARYDRRAEIADYGRYIDSIGHRSTARWLLGEDEALDSAPRFNGKALSWAIDDLDDICRSDAVIMFTDPPGTPSRGGRHFELGYALALAHWEHDSVTYNHSFPRVSIVGDPEHVFHHLTAITRWSSWYAVQRALLAVSE